MSTAESFFIGGVECFAVNADQYHADVMLAEALPLLQAATVTPGMLSLLDGEDLCISLHSVDAVTRHSLYSCRVNKVKLETLNNYWRTNQ